MPWASFLFTSQVVVGLARIARSPFSPCASNKFFRRWYPFPESMNILVSAFFITSGCDELTQLKVLNQTFDSVGVSVNDTEIGKLMVSQLIFWQKWRRVKQGSV